MIPLGLYGAARPVVSGAAIVQYKYAAAATLTLDTPPTPGNLLVIGGGCASDPTAYSHGATEDIRFNQQGWRSFFASAVLAPGASSVVTVSNMLTLQRLSVWELSGVSDCVATDSDVGATSSSAALSLTSGAIGLAIVVQGGTTAATRSASGLTLRTEDNRFLSADGVGISTPLAVGFSWNTNRTYSAVVGGYS